MINPRAGGGRAAEAGWRVERLYREAGIEFAAHRTTGPGDAAARARAAAGECAAVVAVGGDGTMHEVVNGLADAAAGARDPGRVAALASIPIGTGNDFVKSLGIVPDVDAGFAVVRSGRRRRIDLGRATLARNGRAQREWFANDLSVGYGAHVVKDMVDPPFYLRFVTGHLAYLITGILRAFDTAAEMTVRLDGGEPRCGRFHEVHVGNGRFCGGGISFTPRAEIDDGLFDVTTMAKMARHRLIVTLAGDVRGGRLAPSADGAIRFDRARRVEIEQARPFSAYLDGEHREIVPLDGTGAARIEAEIVPAALDVLAP